MRIRANLDSRFEPLNRGAERRPLAGFARAHPQSRRDAALRFMGSPAVEFSTGIGTMNLDRHALCK